MEDTVIEQMYGVLATRRVNVELLLWLDYPTSPIISIRLRPWRNSDTAGLMILAGGYTVEEALLWSVRGLLHNKWIPLNWQQRAHSVGIATPAQGIESSRGASLATESLSEVLTALPEGSGTETLRIVHPDGSQSVLEPIDRPSQTPNRRH